MLLSENTSVIATEPATGAAAFTGKRPKVLLADDHQLILDALRNLMQADFDVLTVDNSSSVPEAIESFQPDLAILDISMPGEDGLATARKVLERDPEFRVIFLSMHGGGNYLERAAQVGAKAFLPKTLPARELISAIRSVLDGENLLPEPAEKSAEGDPAASKTELTSRQREVLRLIALGCSAKDIANQLNISVRTAEFHRAAIMQRLGLHSTAQMTRYAITNDIA